MKKKIPDSIMLWGDPILRDANCPQEGAEQVTFFNALRNKYPDTWGRIAYHARNEGKRNPAQAMQHTAEGMTVGASDIIIMGFYCELKRKDYRLSDISAEQIKFLLAVQECGGYACVALGAEAALRAFEWWLETYAPARQKVV